MARTDGGSSDTWTEETPPAALQRSRSAAGASSAPTGTWTGDEPEELRDAPADEPSAPSPVRYEVLERLGEGGMGTVDAVRDHVLGRVVAHKSLLAKVGARAEQRFVREARLTSQLDHPNVVPVHELGRDAEGRPYFTMRLVQGRSVDQRLQDGSLGSLVARLDLFRKCCDAVAFAHARGVLHTDLKPSNVMVGDFGEVVVVDWGIARRLGSGPDGSADEPPLDDGGGVDGTVDGQIVGTPAWMAPEQARGERSSLDARVDVYGLGAVLYALLTGRAPFLGPAREVLPAVREGRFARPRAVAPEVPVELEAVALAAMATRREDRYPSVAALREDVQAWLEDRPLSVVPETAWVRARRWLRRHRQRVGAVAGSAMVVGVLVVLGLGLHARDTAAANTALAESRDEARQAAREALTHDADSLVALAQVEAASHRGDRARELLRDARERYGRAGADTERADLVASWWASEEAPPFASWSMPGWADGLSLSPDGALLGFLGPGRVLLVDVASGAVSRDLALDGTPVSTRWIDGELVIVGEGGGEPRVWWRGRALRSAMATGGGVYVVGRELWFGDAEAGEIRALSVDEDRVRLVTGVASNLLGVSADGRRFLAADGGAEHRQIERVRLYEGAGDGYRLVDEQPFGGTVSGLSSDGETWWVGGDAGVTLQRPTPLVVPHPGLVAVILGADGSLILGDREGRVTWTTRDGVELGGWWTPGRLAGATRDGRLALTLASERVDLWERPPVSPPSPVDRTVNELVLWEGLLLEVGWEGVLRVRDAETLAPWLELPVEPKGLRDAQVEASGTTALVADRGGLVARWDLVAGRETTRFDCGATGLAMGVTPLPDGRVAAVWESRRVCLFTADGELLRSEALAVLPWEVRHVPSPRRLVVSGRGEGGPSWVALDPDTLAEVARSSVIRVAYELATSPDGSFAVGLHQHALRVDAGGEAELPIPFETLAVAWSPDGRRLLAANLSGQLQVHAGAGDLAPIAVFQSPRGSIGEVVAGDRVHFYVDGGGAVRRFDLSLGAEYLGIPPEPGETTDPTALARSRAAAHARRGEWGEALDELDRAGLGHEDPMRRARWAFAAGRREEAAAALVASGEAGAQAALLNAALQR